MAGDDGADSLAAVRARYAEDLRIAGPIRSAALLRAFATVPRERFLGPGPWTLRDDAYFAAGYVTTPDADPRQVYRNVLVALDAARGINNGSPALWASVLDRLDVAPHEAVLHLGCGTGYYSAILAELVGADGRVVAVEHDAALAERARQALAAWPQVTVAQADGTSFDAGAQDVVVASAGATHPLPRWIAALRPGGRLVLPLTTERRGGFMLKLTRGPDPQALAAESLGRVGFIPFIGARDPAVGEALATALRERGPEPIRSLRLDRHAPDEDCWLHGDTFCLSTRAPGDASAADPPAADAPA